MITTVPSLTACRAGEIGDLRWSEVGADAITLPPARAKNNRQHVVALSAPAKAILAAQPRRANDDGTMRDLVFGVGQGGFAGWSAAKKSIDARIATASGQPLAPWRVHDLRRSAATGMAVLGVEPFVIECVLNHVTGVRSSISKVYNRHGYEPQKRQALDRWAAHLMDLVEGSNVIPLRA
jgi:integrase